MTVRKSDVMLLEGYLRKIAPRMGIKLMDQPKHMNTPYENPILFQFGSNSFWCDRDDLEDMVDAWEDEHMTANGFFEDYLKPLIELRANA